MLEYLDKVDVSYFISITRDHNLILKSSDNIYYEQKDTAYFMASDDALRD